MQIWDNTAFQRGENHLCSVIVSELLNGKMYPGVWSCKGPEGKGVVFWCSLHLPTHMFTLKSRWFFLSTLNRPRFHIVQSSVSYVYQNVILIFFIQIAHTWAFQWNIDFLTQIQAVGTKYTISTWCRPDNPLSSVNHIDIKGLHLSTFCETRTLCLVPKLYW